MADINLNLNFRFTRRQLRNGLALLLMLGVCNELSSESVTLTTYYPAPSGVYTQMITTTNTYLARDSGKVGIGTTSPGANLDVQGSGAGSLLFRVRDSAATAPVAVYGGMDGAAYPDGTGTIMQVAERSGTGRSITTAGSISVGGSVGTATSYINGYLGVNTATPGAMLEVDAPSQAYWLMRLRNQNAGGWGMGFYQVDSGQVYLYNNGQWNISLGPGTGYVGVGSAFNPLAPLDVGGSGYLAVRQVLDNSVQCMGPYGFGVGAPVHCQAGYYATQTTGIYAHVTAVAPSYPVVGSGTMLCCPYQVPIF